MAADRAVIGRIATHIHRISCPIDEASIRKTAWHLIHKRRRTPFFHQILVSAFSIRDTGHPFDNRVPYTGAIEEFIVVRHKEYRHLGQLIVAQQRKDPHFLTRLMRSTIVRHKRQEKKWKRIASRQYAGMSTDELCDDLSAYVCSLLDFRLALTHPLFAGPQLEDELRRGLIKIFGRDEGARWFNVAATPVQPGLPLREEEALLSLAGKGQPTKVVLRAHIEEFCHMANVRYDATFYDEAYYRKRLTSITPARARERLLALRASRRNHAREFALLLRLLRKKKHFALAILARMVNLAVFFRSYRIEIWYGSMRYVTPLFEEVARRLGLPSFRDAFYCYWEELELALRTGTSVKPSVIRARKKGYSVLALQDGAYCAWDGKESDRIARAFQETLASSSSVGESIHGAGAYPGTVQGKAFVAHTLADTEKIRKGDILVIHATNNNLIPHLKRVSAIVTEEGGILSHAAIISRELKIPCVIGTKVATSVIKTGDRITVDATSGSVTLKK